jgi:N-acyl-D-glutamate deacylase
MKSAKDIARIIGTAAVACGLLAAAIPAVAQDYDVVILNGRVMDPETRYDAIANVGIKDGTIVVITEDGITGQETIDATGLVVAPGFIDTHWHYDRPWSNKLALRDGRTTALDLEIGTHGPYIDQWYREREGNNQVNYGQAVGHEFARAVVLDGFEGAQDVRTAVESRKGDGWCCKRPTLEEGNRILQLLDEGLQAGGLGIGSTLGYMRDGVSPREFFEVQRLAGHYGRQTGAHFRYTPGTDTTETNGIQDVATGEWYTPQKREEVLKTEPTRPVLVSRCPSRRSSTG